MLHQESEDRELEVERTRAFNLNAVRDDETRSGAPSARSSRTHNSQKQAPIKPSILVPKQHLKDPFPLNTYYQKINSILNDHTKFTPLSNDPTERREASLQRYLRVLKSKGALSDVIYS